MSSIKKFDVFFVFYSLTLRVKGGREVEFRLLNRLVKDGYDVGALFLRNIDLSLYKRIKDVNLGSYIKSSSLSDRFKAYITNVLINSNIGYHLILPLLKRFYAIGESNKDYLAGSKILFGSKVPKNLSIKFLVATGWKTAFFVENIPFADRTFNIIQQDDRMMGHQLVGLEEKGYALDTEKIVINDSLKETFKIENVNKITIGIDREKYHLINKPESHKEKEILVPLRKPVHKGAKYAIEAMRMIHEIDDNVIFTAYGDFPNSDVPAFVNFLGWITDEELVNLYNRSTIIVIPSILEGFCLPGLEAMACGCALVTTDNKGIHEYAKNDINCKIVPIKSPQAIADACMFLIRNKEIRVSLAYNGATTSSQYTFDRTYVEFKKILGINDVG